MDLVLNDLQRWICLGLMSKVFANGPGEWGSIPGLKKWYLIPPYLTLSIIK